MKLDFIYKHEVDKEFDLDWVDWAFPLPEGLPVRIMDHSRSMKSINGTGIYVKLENQMYIIYTLLNGRSHSFDGLPTRYCLEHGIRLSDPSKQIDSYAWFDSNENLHNLKGPAIIHCFDYKVTSERRYIRGMNMGSDNKFKTWMIDNGIDYMNMTDEDIQLFNMRWGSKIRLT